MKNKFIISVFILAGIVFTTLLLSLPLINAETEIYEIDKVVDLKFTCTLNNAIPTSASYNITISYPNGSTFLNNQNTTALGNGAFTYTTTFTELGLYKVQMFCWDGAYSYSGEGYYQITGNGKDNPEGIVIVLFSLIFLIVLGGMLYQFILCFGHFASLDLDIVDLAKTMGLYFALLGLYFLSLYYLGNQTVEKFLLLGIQIGGFTHVIIPLVGFLISITIGSLKKKKIDFGVKRLYRKNVGSLGGFK